MPLETGYNGGASNMDGNGVTDCVRDMKKVDSGFTAMTTLNTAFVYLRYLAI